MAEPDPVFELGKSPEALVTALYRLLLVREPDPDGLAAYAGALRSNRLTVDQVARTLVESAEFKRRTGSAADYVRVKAHGCDFVVPSGAPVAAELVSEEGYEPWVLPYFLIQCRPGMTVVDLGASWGAFALPAARRVGRDGVVFAVEVSHWNCQVLFMSAKASSLDNVRILPFGVSDRLGCELLANQHATNNNGLQPGRDVALDDVAGYSLVPVLPLDLLRSALGRVHVLKMDIEGMEYRASLGAISLLQEQRPLVFTEYSPEFQRAGSKVDGAELLGLFLDLGYHIEILHRDVTRELVTGLDRSATIARVDQVWRRHVEVDGGSHLDLCLHPGQP
jgi:FkbM family methyltransferase